MTARVPVTMQRKPYMTVRRISAEEVQDLVVKYEAGATVNELAKYFGIHRTTVSAELHRQGVAIRGVGLTGQQIGESVLLYDQGWSVAKIGRYFDVDGMTVWRSLRQIGIRMLSPHERPSAEEGTKLAVDA